MNKQVPNKKGMFIDYLSDLIGIEQIKYRIKKCIVPFAVHFKCKKKNHSKNNKLISRLRSHNTYRDHILCDEFKKSALTLIFQQKRSKRY